MLLDVIYESSDVRILFDDLNDVRNTKSLMLRTIGAEYTKAVKN